MNENTNLTPRKIVEYLDQYIISVLYTTQAADEL